MPFGTNAWAVEHTYRIYATLSCQLYFGESAEGHLPSVDDVLQKRAFRLLYFS